MGRKDPSGCNTQPVEQYRKQIGKQDWKKSRNAVKSMKNKPDEATPQQIVRMIALLVVVMAGLYALLLWSVQGGLVQERPENPVT